MKSLTQRTAIILAFSIPSTLLLANICRQETSEQSELDKKLCVAVQKKDSNSIVSLVNLGAKAHTRDNYRLTPLYWAVQGEWPEQAKAIEALLKADSDQTGQGRDMNTPLHVTTNPEIAQLLMQNPIFECNTNAANNEGNTPLHTHVDRDNLAMTNFLLENYANPNCRNINGQTPMHLANNLEIMSALTNYGADITLTDNDHIDTLHRANVQRQPKLKAFLERIWRETTGIEPISPQEWNKIHEQHQTQTERLAEKNKNARQEAQKRRTELRQKRLIDHLVEKTVQPMYKAAQDIGGKCKEWFLEQLHQAYDNKPFWECRAVLNISYEDAADQTKVTQAYKQAALRYHPDHCVPNRLGSKKECDEIFKIINMAAEALKDTAPILYIERD